MNFRKVAARLVAALVMAPGASLIAADAAQARPNILFIFSDDHAQHAISAYGSKVNRTPNIDRLAEGGVRFVNSFVTNSICTPSRATLLTGQYSHLNGVPVFNRFDGSRDTVAKHLRAGGYHTGVIGKWHLGSDPTGFDRWIVLPGQGAYRDPTFLVPGHTLSIKGHCTEVTTDLGIEWLETRPRDKPFFLMLHQKAPHRRMGARRAEQGALQGQDHPRARDPAGRLRHAPRRAAGKPADRRPGPHPTRPETPPPADLAGPDRARWLNVKPTDVEVTRPDGTKATLTGDDLIRWKYQRFMQDYLACVQGVDDSVGKVLDYLDRAGLAKDTIVFYSADNGWYLGDLGLYDKRFMYEPGLRVPLLVRGPGIKAGGTPAQFVANIDLAPTFLDLAGLSIPDSMQGRSLAPCCGARRRRIGALPSITATITTPATTTPPRHLGVRTATHKLIHYWKKDAYEMYDLARDPFEQHNLLFDAEESKRPEVAGLFAELKSEIARLKRHYKDDGQYADPADWPPGSADGPFNDKPPIGLKTIPEAIAATGAR